MRRWISNLGIGKRPICKFVGASVLAVGLAGAVPAQAAVLTPYVGTYEILDFREYEDDVENFVQSQFAPILDGLTSEQRNDPETFGPIVEAMENARASLIEPFRDALPIFGLNIPASGPDNANISEADRNAGFLLSGKAPSSVVPFPARSTLRGEVQVELNEDLSNKIVNVSLSNRSDPGSTGPTSFRLTPFLSVTDIAFEQFLPQWEPFIINSLAIDVTLNPGETLEFDVTDSVIDVEALQLDGVINSNGLPLSFAFMIDALDANEGENALLQAEIDVIDLSDLGNLVLTRLGGEPSSLLAQDAFFDAPLFVPTTIPVPAAGPLLALGLGAFAFIRRRRKAAV